MMKTVKLKSALGLATVSTIALLGGIAWAAGGAGLLDVTFGAGEDDGTQAGVVSTSLGDGNDAARDVALQADGKGKVVASPRVITADKAVALIEQGTELPYQTATSSGATAITFRKANLKLEVTPQITPEGSVILDVDVNKDSVGQITTAGFAINTKHVKTQVRVEDGGTVVLGGIYEETDRNNAAKVPGLGDVPGLGWLFKNRDQVQRKSELLIFLTPRIMADGPATAQP